MSFRDLWKVTGDIMVQKGEKTKVVKKEVLIEAVSLTDVDVSATELFKTMTTFPESVVIVKAEMAKVECIVLTDDIEISSELVAGKFKWDLAEPESGDDDEVNMYIVVVDFFGFDEKEGDMKKVSSSNYYVAANSVAEAYREIKLEMKECVAENKIASIKPVKTVSVLLEKLTHQSCQAHYDNYTSVRR